MLRERLAARLRIVAPALRQRLGSEWAAAEIDLVLVHYLYGLTMEASPDAGPDTQIGLLGDLGRIVIDPDALDRALHTAPPPASAHARAGSLARAVIAAETFGRRDAQATVAVVNGDPHQTIEPNSNVKPIRHAT